MREEEIIMDGILFCPGDDELKAMKLRTHNLIWIIMPCMRTKPNRERR